MSDTYRIERTPHGLTIYGPVPVGEFQAITRMAESLGFDKMLMGVATAIGATMALTSDEHEAAWREEIAQRAKAEARGDAELEWLKGDDTGISSLTIFQVLCSPANLGAAEAKLGDWPGDVPQDPSDFGRCHRLLERFPEWREHLDRVADAYPRWRSLVEAWPELTALYLEELPTGYGPKLYARMRALIEAQRV